MAVHSVCSAAAETAAWILSAPAAGPASGLSQFAMSVAAELCAWLLIGDKGALFRIVAILLWCGSSNGPCWVEPFGGRQKRERLFLPALRVAIPGLPGIDAQWTSLPASRRRKWRLPVSVPVSLYHIRRTFHSPRDRGEPPVFFILMAKFGPMALGCRSDCTFRSFPLIR